MGPIDDDDDDYDDGGDVHDGNYGVHDPSVVSRTDRAILKLFIAERLPLNKLNSPHFCLFFSMKLNWFEIDYILISNSACLFNQRKKIPYHMQTISRKSGRAKIKVCNVLYKLQIVRIRFFCVQFAFASGSKFELIKIVQFCSSSDRISF